MRFRYVTNWVGAMLLAWPLWALAGAALAAVALGNVSVAWAQEEDLDAPPDEDADGPAAPAQGAAAPQGAADSAPESASQPPQSQLSYFFRALGVVYSIIFLGLSFVLVALIVMNILTLRRQSIVPMQLVEGFEAQLNEKRYQEAYDMAKSDDSFLGHVLSAGLGKLSAGYPQAIEAMQEVGEEETMKLEHRLGYVALIGTISPMVGLFGTVHGMINSFQTIANAVGQPKPAALADGISMALVTTLFGLLLAIPAIAAFGIMRNRMARLTLEVGILSEGLMSRFSNVGKKS